MNTPLPSTNDVGSLFTPAFSVVPSKTVAQNAFRLDAESYSPEVLAAQKALRGKKFRTVILSKVAKVFGFGPFKRTYISRSEYGLPLLSSSEIVEIQPSPNILAKSDCPKWQQYMIRKGWIVISCSGTIGNVAIIPRKWDTWALSQHAIRIIPNEGYTGFLYSFLRLPWVTQQILGMKSGSVIDEIYPDDLNRLEIPLVDEECLKSLEDAITKVMLLREEGDELIKEAESLVYKANGLRKLNEEDVACLDPDGQIESVSVSSKEVSKTNQSGSEFRLDAHYYNPLSQLAIENIKNCKGEVKTVGDVTQRVFMCNRFKRNYVEEKHGAPFLSGKNIVQIRPTELKYISLSETQDLDELKLRQNWTLITRSGTLGRTCLIFKNYEDWAATEHIIRMVPNEDSIDPAYLYGFLSSRYGYLQIVRYRHGSVIDEITDKQVKKILIPLPSSKEQKQIGDLVRSAYEKRDEAIRLEDEAQQILINALSS